MVLAYELPQKNVMFFSILQQMCFFLKEHISLFYCIFLTILQQKRKKKPAITANFFFLIAKEKELL